MAGGSNTQYLAPMGLPQSGSPIQTGAGGSTRLQFRDPVDAARSIGGTRTPEAQYPDGYLGPITTRREDRVLRAVRSRLSDRSYTRGVHVGERIEPLDYYWPDDFGPYGGMERGLAAVKEGPLMMVARAVPLLTMQERLTMMGENLPRGAAGMVSLDPRAAERLNALRPLARI